LARYLISVVLVVVAMGLNILGVEVVGTMSLVLTAAVLLPFILLIGYASKYVVVKHGANTTAFVRKTWAEVPDSEDPGLGVQWGLFLSVLLWANAGFDESGSVAERIKDPAKSYTYGTLASVLLIMLVYLLPTAAGVLVVPWQNWTDATFETVADEAAGPWLRVVLTFAAFIGCYGSYISLVCTSSLGLKCLAELDIVPKIFAYEHPTLETPVVAIVFCSAVTSGMCYFSFDTVVQVGTVLYAFALFLEWGSVLMLRVREPQLLRPFVIPLQNFTLCCK
jgi:amino acid transporter